MPYRCTHCEAMRREPGSCPTCKMPMRFVLINEPSRPKKRKFESNTGKQTVMFSGLNCLPGQEDLFPTDGSE